MQKIVDRFDQNGLVLKTDQMEPNELSAEPERESEVSKMAKHALKKG